MHPRTIQLAGKEVRRVGLGTNRLTNTPVNAAFVKSAAAAGVGVFDTAHLYTGGDSEATIGAALGSSLPEGTVIATKGGYRPGEGRPDVLRSHIQESLRRLRSHRIELWYLHRVDPQTPLEQSLGVVREFVDSGQIGAVGLSNVDVAQIERARKLVPIAAVQNEFNLSSRGREEVIDHCEREGIVFVPFFPLHGDRPALGSIARAHGVTETQIALAWLLHRSPAMLPIPGTLSLAHVEENLAALDVELTDEDYAALS